MRSRLYAALDPRRMLHEPVRQARAAYERAAREQGSPIEVRSIEATQVEASL
jgi:hypothetical protein